MVEYMKQHDEETTHSEDSERAFIRRLIDKTRAKISLAKPTLNHALRLGSGQVAPASAVKGTLVPSTEDVVFGREEIIADIRANLSKNQSVLLTGPLGIGKTHLLKYISTSLGRDERCETRDERYGMKCREMRDARCEMGPIDSAQGKDALYIPSPSSLKNVLTQILDKLEPHWKYKMQERTTTRNLSDLLAKAKGATPIVLMIDNLDVIKVSDIDAILNLLSNFTILAAADDMKPKLKQIWWKFKQMELAPLGEAPARELIKHLTKELSISDYEMLETKLLTLSNGIPLAIVDTVEQLSHLPCVTKDDIRGVYHEAGIRYRDWSNVIIFIYWIAVLFRFVAGGTHSYESYFLAGFGITLLMILKNVAGMLK
jgi:hypothetical protein